MIFWVINVHQYIFTLNILLDKVDRGLGHENKTYCYTSLISIFLKNCCGWLKVTLIISIVVTFVVTLVVTLVTTLVEKKHCTKKMTMGKKDDRSRHENTIKDPPLFHAKVHPFLFRYLRLKKSRKRFIKELYHKRNPLITTVVDGNIFWKMLRL